MPKKLNTLQASVQAKDVARSAYRATMSEPLCRHFGLIDQIRRSCNSVPANIIEGYALGTRPQLVRCLRIAFASACELSWHIEFAADLELLAPEQARPLLDSADRLTGLLVGLIKKLSPPHGQAPEA